MHAKDKFSEDQMQKLKQLLLQKDQWAQYIQSDLDLGVSSLAKTSSLKNILKQQLYSHLNHIELYKLIQDSAENQVKRVRVTNKATAMEEKQEGASPEIQD